MNEYKNEWTSYYEDIYSRCKISDFKTDRKQEIHDNFKFNLFSRFIGRKKIRNDITIENILTGNKVNIYSIYHYNSGTENSIESMIGERYSNLICNPENLRNDDPNFTCTMTDKELISLSKVIYNFVKFDE